MIFHATSVSNLLRQIQISKPGVAKGFSLTRDGTQIGRVMRDLLFSQRVTRDFPFIEISVMIFDFFFFFFKILFETRSRDSYDTIFLPFLLVPRPLISLASHVLRRPTYAGVLREVRILSRFVTAVSILLPL